MVAIPYEDESFFMTICERLCQEPELSQQASETAQDMADLLGSVDWLPDDTPQRTAAIAVYMVSHIMGEAASLAEVSEVSGIHVERIRSPYRLIHPNRE